MKQSSLNNILPLIAASFPKDAADISDALELLHLALDGVRENANRQMKQSADDKDYSKSQEMLGLSSEVSKIQDLLTEFATLFSNTADDEEEDAEPEEPDITKEQKEIPNYSEYTVDSSVPHTLYENFTHKKATAFALNGEYYEAKDWKDVLLQTCDLLSEIDADMFYDFIKDPTMRGRKNAYFGDRFVERKNAKLKNIDVYVWTNLSANHIRNLIRKMLKKFDIRIADFYIYLRADYTALHRDDEPTSKIDSFASPTDKVGKYVRLSLRQISNKQRRFSKNELTAMQSKQWSKEVLDIDYPLLKPFQEGIAISDQIREGSYGRYWKEIFEFGGQKFLATSQWYDRSRELFAKWLESLV